MSKHETYVISQINQHGTREQLFEPFPLRETAITLAEALLHADLYEPPFHIHRLLPGQSLRRSKIVERVGLPWKE